MCDNIERHGVSSQKNLYRQPGREVISVYEEMTEQKKSRGEIILAMERKIKYLGPTNVSKHCSDRNNVVDVSVAYLDNGDDFLREIRMKASKVIDERGSNGCYHIEF